VTDDWDTAQRPRGFALLTVLWLMTVASIVALAGGLVARNGIDAARNRIQMERAFWIAMGCARRTQAAIDETLREGLTSEDAAARWRRLDREVGRSSVLIESPCEVRLEAAGTRLDVNAASDTTIERLLRGLGDGDDALERSNAVADWRDADDVPRPSGAERDWYAMVGREVPRNDDLADLRELARVRGFEMLSRYDTVFTVEPGRISLATAPAAVLMAVPGITRETAERIAALRDAGTPLRDLIHLPGMLSEASREELLAHYADIARLTTVDPGAWILTSRARIGFPASHVALEWRVVRAGRRGVIVRTRNLE
jgi:general secretion pathway protein K